MTPRSASAAAPVRLVVLDFDGTLADSFDGFRSVLNGVADRYRFRRVEPGEVEALWRARRPGDRAAARHRTP